jgi:hypothetical protein
MAARAVYDRVLAGNVAAREDDRHILIFEKEMYLPVIKIENETKISQTKPRRFLHLT